MKLKTDMEKVSYTYASVKGTKHKENWDNLLVIEEADYCIFAVFDGVSSAKDGKEATREAKAFIRSNYKKYLHEKVDLQTLMFDLNNSLLASEWAEPYSTYCLVYFDKNVKSYHYSWLGDSRIYVITNQFIEQITCDDSFSEHIITKFLGHPSLKLDDFRQCESRKEFEHLLLCTDGFYRVFESNRLEFFDNFRRDKITVVKDKINSLIKGKNYDDSTFIFFK